MEKLLLIMLILMAITLSYSIASAQSVEPCSAVETAQFDFWLGEWNAEWKNSDGKTETGTNSITKILGSCIVEENFTAGDKSLIGKSVSAYNVNKKIWQQTWVDNTGAYLDFTGGMEGDKMILSRKITAKDGRKIIQRMVFYDIKPNEFLWNWESSADNGTTWKLAWKIHYTRK